MSEPNSKEVEDHPKEKTCYNKYTLEVIIV